MRYNTIKYNDIANSPGVAVSVYLQGCPPPHCNNCFNPETWDFSGGQELTDEVIQDIIDNLYVNNIQRSLCILGGEPLCDLNIPATAKIIKAVKAVYPEIKVYVWSRYLIETLQDLAKVNNDLNYILNNIYCLVDGPYKEELRQIDLPMRGSLNQRILYFDNVK